MNRTNTCLLFTGGRRRWLFGLTLGAVCVFSAACGLTAHERKRQPRRRIQALEQPAKLPAGTYKNPIVQGVSLGDPYVLFDQGRYYLYGTRWDGFRFMHSTDMVHWNDGGEYYDIFAHPFCTHSFWAPEVHRVANRYYLMYTCVHEVGFTAGNGRQHLMLAVGDAPGGPFRDVAAPWLPEMQSVIDPTLFVDSDGRAYAYFVSVGLDNAGIFGRIYGVELASDLVTAKGEPQLLLEAQPGWELSDPKNRTNEGPTLFKRGGDYYLLYSANFYADPAYALGYARAASPLGPWAKYKSNPVLRQNSTLDVLATGHASVTVSPDGKQYFIVYQSMGAADSQFRNTNMDLMLFDAQGDWSVEGPTRSVQALPPSLAAKPSP